MCQRLDDCGVILINEMIAKNWISILCNKVVLLHCNRAGYESLPEPHLFGQAAQPSQAHLFKLSEHLSDHVKPKHAFTWMAHMGLKDHIGQ